MNAEHIAFGALMAFVWLVGFVIGFSAVDILSGIRGMRRHDG